MTRPLPPDQCEHGYTHGRGCPDCPDGQGIIPEAAEAVGVPTGALVSVRRQLADSWEAVYWQDCQRWSAMLSRDRDGVLFMAGYAEALKSSAAGTADGGCSRPGGRLSGRMGAAGGTLPSLPPANPEATA